MDVDSVTGVQNTQFRNNLHVLNIMDFTCFGQMKVRDTRRKNIAPGRGHRGDSFVAERSGGKDYLRSTSFLVSEKPLASSLYRYTPDGRFAPLNTTVCRPADSLPLTSVATVWPMTL